jgi:hypothetical protein
LSSATLNLKWPSMWLLLAALAIAHSYGPANLIISVLPAIGVTVMASKPQPPKTDYRSKLGPIPLDNFGNDPPYIENVDTSKDKVLSEQIAKEIERAKKK